MAKLVLLIDVREPRERQSFEIQRPRQIAIPQHDFHLGQQPVIIGRSGACDIRLPSDEISRKQAGITFDDERYYIDVRFPLTSTGAVRRPARLNGIPVMDRNLLRHGDLIQMGRYQFRFDEPKHTFVESDLDTRWLSSTVMELARTIHELQAFDRLPILADALMDAGCDSDEIIQHCQGSGPHGTGCWVVELLMGRKESSREEIGC